MLGIDVVEVERVVKANKNGAIEKKILTKQEKDYLLTKSTTVVNKFSERDYSLAGFWAAKEAVLKALELGIIVDLKQVEICHKENGAPYVKLAKALKDKYNIDKNLKFELSTSHDAGVAVSVCNVAEI